MQMQTRDLRDFIPSRHKTVYLEESLIVGALGSLLPLLFSCFIFWFMQLAIRDSLVKNDWTGVVLVGGVCGFIWSFLTFAGMLMLYVSLDGWSCMSLKVFSGCVGISQEALIAAAGANNILPRYDIKGVRVYRTNALWLLHEQMTPGAARSKRGRIRNVLSDNRGELIYAVIVCALLLCMFRIIRTGTPVTNQPRVFVSPRTHKRYLIPPENPNSPEPIVGNPHWQHESHSGF